MASFGDFISSVGHSLNLPDLGIGAALGGQNSLPGALQGVNPTTYQGVAGGNYLANSPIQNVASTPSAYINQTTRSLGQQADSTGGSTGGAYGSTGGAAYDPNTDPNMVSQAQGLVQGDQNTLNSLYAAINGALTNYAQDARGRVDQQYQNQFNQNNNQFTNSVNTANQIFGGRGTFDSSDRGNTLDAYKADYDNANTGLDQSKQSAYGQIGDTIQGVQSQVDAKPQYDLSQYNDVNSLTALHNQLGQHIASLQATQGKLTPQGDLVNKLNAVAPVTSDLGKQLQSKLTQLQLGNADPYAKQALAQGYIDQAGLDPKDKLALQGYWKNLMSQPGTTTPSATPAVATAGA